MRLEVKGNPNYCATIIVIDNIIELEGCDNIQSSLIFGCNVIISKDVKIGDIGIYFPAETALSDNFLSVNNLYRDKELNVDKNKVGFFEKNRRIRTMKLRGFKSEGFFTPLSSLNCIIKNQEDILNFEIGTDFDHIDGQMICEKYFVPTKQVQNISKNNRIKRFNRLLNNQYRLHIDTGTLAKNIYCIQPTDLIQISEKIHGSSFISSNILCNKKLTLKDKIAKWLGVNVIDKEYDNIFGSRKVIKNQYLYKNKLNHLYEEDIWGIVNKELQSYLLEGMTIYGEVCGYLSTGKPIQKNFDYGCSIGKHDIYIYRITTTSPSGKVFEWSTKQIQDWCKQNGLKAVLEHYYGYAKDLFKDISSFIFNDVETWQHLFLKNLQETYLEKDCMICKNKVPAEGICLRKESLDIEIWKLKSSAFRLMETKLLDEGLNNIEDNQ